ncbi:MAG: choice-of-anchor J domain-containing protein, partial [Nitrospirota bacterium]
TFDTVGLSSLRLSFWHKYEIGDQYFSNDPGDYAKVEVSTDNGATWTEVASYGFNQTQTHWAETSIDLSPYIGNTSVKVRFRLTTDRGNNADGWYIDDVVIEEASITTTLPFSDDMESGAGKWFVSSHWTQITTGCYSGTCWTDSPDGDYTGNTNASLETLTFDTVGLSSLRLSFWHKYWIGATDYAKVEVSTDNGANWTDVASYGPDQTQTHWVETSIDLSPYIGNTSVKIRFRLTTDRGDNADGWYIDDVVIGEIGTTLKPMISPQGEDNIIPSVDIKRDNTMAFGCGGIRSHNGDSSNHSGPVSSLTILTLPFVIRWMWRKRRDIVLQLSNQIKM